MLTVLLVSIALLQIVLLVILLRRKAATKAPEEILEHAASVATIDIRGKLTSIRWFSEMMLDGDNGELTIAQIEFVHQMNTASCSAIDRLACMIRALEDPQSGDVSLRNQCVGPLHLVLERVRGTTKI